MPPIFFGESNNANATVILCFFFFGDFPWIILHEVWVGVIFYDPCSPCSTGFLDPKSGHCHWVFDMLFFIQLFVQGFSEGDTNTPYSAYSPYSSLRYIGFGSKLPHKKWGPVFSVVLGKGIFLWCICFHAWYSGIKYIDYTWYQYFYVFFTINGFNMDFHLKNTYLPGWFVFIRTKEYSPRYFFFYHIPMTFFPQVWSLPAEAQHPKSLQSLLLMRRE